MYPIGDSDYMLDRTSLTFLNGASLMQQMCVLVSIIGDDVIYINETFMVIFTLETPDMFQGSSIVNITIIDNETVSILAFI